jgi:hypothetical protein
MQGQPTQSFVVQAPGPCSSFEVDIPEEVQLLAKEALAREIAMENAQLVQKLLSLDPERLLVACAERFVIECAKPKNTTMR